MGQQAGQLAGDPGPSRPTYQDFKANLWDSTSEFGGDLSAVLVNIDSRCHADCCYLDVLQAPNQPFLAFWDATGVGVGVRTSGSDPDPLPIWRFDPLERYIPMIW